MEASHHTSDLDPSSVLGFGSALALLDSTEEVARLLTGALRSMGLADLQAVVLDRSVEDAPRVLGSVGARPLPDPVVDELRRGVPFTDVDDGRTAPSNRHVAVPEESALAAQGIDRLATVRLGTLDQEFGMAVAGLVEAHTHTPLERSSLQMMAAQTSMALHRIALDRERAAQEEALRESEARYRELYENAPVAYVSATAEGEICMANRRATELLDAPEAALVGRSLPGLCADTPEGRAAAQRLEERLRSGAPVRDDEVELCRIDGERIWVSLTMRPLEADDDRSNRLVMMVDVTERRRMKTALREARDELEDRVDERTADLERANERLEQRTQRLKALRDIDQAILAAESPEEIASATLRRTRRMMPFVRASVSVIDWEADRARVLATRQEDEVLADGTTMPLDDFYMPDALRAGKPAVIPDLTDRPRSGTTADKIRDMGVRSVLCLPMAVDGDVIGTLMMGRTEPDAFTDTDRRVGTELADHLAIALRQARLRAQVETRTTELEQTNERLAHQTHRLHTLRDIDQAILAAESPEEIAAVAVRRVREILPYESATVTVTDWDAETAHVLAAVDNVLDSPTTLSLGEVHLSAALRNGETEVLSAADYAPVPEAQERMDAMGLQSILCVPMVVEDEVIGVVHVGRTQPDAFTEDDWRIGRELADHMAIAIRQSRLLEAVQAQRERLEERVRERTEELESFTYSVSHDLRTPLRAIDGYTRILKEDHADQLDEEGRRLLNVVYESAQTMGTLIDDLLTLSRLGRHEMSHVTIDMEALAQETIDEVRRAHDATAAFDLGPLPEAAGDRSMLRQVLSNLVANAVKFTQNEEAPRIKVHGEVRDGECVYAVEDNGVGFAPNRAEDLFGVFERAHEADDFAGTGVGLAIVERIVRRHDGRVWAEGREGEGASFFFALPPPETVSS